MDINLFQKILNGIKNKLRVTKIEDIDKNGIVFEDKVDIHYDPNTDNIVSTETTVFKRGSCGHIIYSENDLGGTCWFCGKEYNCKKCIFICSGKKCHILVCRACMKILDGKIYCPYCYREEKLKSMFRKLIGRGKNG